jgi:hypothetical protein
MLKELPTMTAESMQAASGVIQRMLADATQHVNGEIGGWRILPQDTGLRMTASHALVHPANSNPSNPEGFGTPHGSRELSSELVVWYYRPGRHADGENIETKGFATRRLPWRRDMTLCVAAESRAHRTLHHSIVFAADFEVEGETARAEIGRKVIYTSLAHYPVLIAGTQTRAISLAQKISYLLDVSRPEKGEVHTPPPWEQLLSEAIRLQKNDLANEITAVRFGLTYERFLEIGKASLPEEIFRETVAEISRTPLDCQLLVLGFSQSLTGMYRVSPTGLVEICDNFAAIGSGYYLAESSFFQRSQKGDNNLGTTIYNVFEAMKLGASAPGVGEKFEIGVAEWEWFEKLPTNEGCVRCSYLEPQYYAYLEKKFKQYGPKQITTVDVKPRWIKEPQQILTLTPKGMHDPKIKKDMERAAKRREALKQRLVSERIKTEDNAST